MNPETVRCSLRGYLILTGLGVMGAKIEQRTYPLLTMCLIRMSGSTGAVRGFKTTKPSYVGCNPQHVPSELLGRWRHTHGQHRWRW
jgi:hypothetical protein